MEYQYITVKGIRIAYLEQNPSGDQLIFFFHGNSGSGATWNHQLQSDLLASYRLIAFDLPAHGDSDALTLPGMDYSLPFIGHIMAGAVQQVAGNAPFILAGVSLGCNVIAEMLAYGLTPTGIVLAGPCVVGSGIGIDKAFQPDIDMHAGFSDTVPEEELREYAKLAFSSSSATDWKNFSNDYYRVKDGFRSKLFTTVMAGNYSDEINLLRQQPAPLLVTFGAAEKASNTSYLDEAGLNLWRDKIHMIPSAGHFIQTDQPQALNQLIYEYSRELFK